MAHNLGDTMNELPEYVSKELIIPTYQILVDQIDRLANLADIEPEPLSLEALELAEKTVGLDEVFHAND